MAASTDCGAAHVQDRLLLARERGAPAGPRPWPMSARRLPSVSIAEASRPLRALRARVPAGRASPGSSRGFARRCPRGARRRSRRVLRAPSRCVVQGRPARGSRGRPGPSSRSHPARARRLPTKLPDHLAERRILCRRRNRRPSCAAVQRGSVVAGHARSSLVPHLIRSAARLPSTRAATSNG